MKEWFQVSPSEIAGILVSLVVLYAWVILLTRVFGLRSFSKMSAADFAMTIAVGSILGSAIVNPKPSVLVAGLGLSGLFAAQLLIAHLRRKSATLESLLDNDPVYLMKDGKLLTENLKRTGVSIADVRAKLREANALRLDQVAAVIFETTGDVSVLHGCKAAQIDPFIIEDVTDPSGNASRVKN